MFAVEVVPVVEVVPEVEVVPAVEIEAGPELVDAELLVLEAEGPPELEAGAVVARRGVPVVPVGQEQQPEQSSG